MTLDFIIRLKRSYEAYENEIKLAKETPYPEYWRFLKALTFYAFIEEVVNACAMFPRSIETCRQNLDDLSFGIIQEFGIDRYHLSHLDRDRLRNLVVTAGLEVIASLEGHRYYIEPHQFPRGKEDDPHYFSDLTAISKVTRINNFTFSVHIFESHFDDLNDLPQNAAQYERTILRSY